MVPGLDGSGGLRGQPRQGLLRMRVLSWASPPVTQEWPSRCGQHPGRTGPWGQRRSACHPQTGSRRERTGPHWKADGSGDETHGKCSHGHPGGHQGQAWSGAMGQQWPPPHTRKGTSQTTQGGQAAGDLTGAGLQDRAPLPSHRARDGQSCSQVP